jgi:hypothetical protein
MDNYKAECILSGPYADQMNNIINQRIWCDGECPHTQQRCSCCRFYASVVLIRSQVLDEPAILNGMYHSV